MILAVNMNFSVKMSNTDLQLLRISQFCHLLSSLIRAKPQNISIFNRIKHLESSVSDSKYSTIPQLNALALRTK